MTACKLHARNVAVAEAMADAGVEARITLLDAHTKTAAQAAAHLGCEVGAIANSLVFAVPAASHASGGSGAPTAVLVMASGAARIDTAVAAAALGVAALERATPDLVKSTTGQVIGGVAPTGHPVPLRTIVDEHLASYETIWAAAGTSDSLMSLTYDELLRITGGTPARVR